MSDEDRYLLLGQVQLILLQHDVQEVTANSPVVQMDLAVVHGVLLDAAQVIAAEPAVGVNDIDEVLNEFDVNGHSM